MHNDIKLLDYNSKVLAEIFGAPKPEHYSDLPAAPNPEHFADLATWRTAVSEWDKAMELAAGCACCADDL